MTKTPFYELAEKIGNDMEGNHPVNTLLIKSYDLKYYSFFHKYFQVTDVERDGVKFLFHNPSRILALLFADLLWQDEMKKK